ncbi:MAG: PD40 domain-containing protein [Herpetosiphonaceae bacterium]|nr:PD40 domain-containing protein [Herpetosiphonaceae bacterium]
MLLRFRLVMIVALLALLVGCGGTGTGTLGFGRTTGGGTAGAVSGCPDAPGPITGPLVFGANQNGLAAIALDGSNVMTLVKPSINDRAYDPFWSPDGKTLAYTFARPSTNPNLSWLQVGMICGLDQATGKGRVLLQAVSPSESLEDATWTPDGKGFIVTHHQPQLDSQGNYSGDDVALQRIDQGGKPQTIMKDATSPMLSADGQHLVYVHVDPNTNAMILMVAGADGRNPQALTNQRSAFITIVNPHWSPAGSQIVFTASGGASKAEAAPARGRSLVERLLGIDVAEAHGLPSDLWMIGADGQNLQRLTNKGLDDPRATWSPDGHSIVFVGGGFGGIFRIDPATKSEQMLSKQGYYGGIALK